jgi:hypothetical protein
MLIAIAKVDSHPHSGAATMYLRLFAMGLLLSILTATTVWADDNGANPPVPPGQPSQFGGKFQGKYGGKFEGKYGGKFQGKYGGKFEGKYGGKFQGKYGGKFGGQFGKGGMPLPGGQFDPQKLKNFKDKLNPKAFQHFKEKLGAGPGELGNKGAAENNKQKQ